MKAPEIRARIFAVAAGIALFFFVALVSDAWSKASSLVLFTFFVGTYTVTGIIFGCIWPDIGWRFGLYLFAVWPPVLALAILFAWEQPIGDVRGTLVDLVARHCICSDS
jgi:hypothetical protein